MAQKPDTIGALSKRSGVKVTTIRYYESIGLMREPDRSSSGQRIYGEDAVERLNFIRHTRELGFPVEAIRELIQLQTKPGEDCAIVDAIARRHLAAVRHRLSQLEALEGELKRMIVSCAGGEIGSCNVLACLSNHDDCLTDTHEKIDIPLKN
ncbi:helix-turn-helix domain-containing protein [Parvularcula sp. IMCC14364]|uniref:MerR family transcriptional regulator n=1 Tax=Parvularcula sp. IMCC14364 TaxID=3067902 RepID=UPI0027411690|nr:helix-turn-helix domain-containing protein [Parvularcula sp. IMCC14364]